MQIRRGLVGVGVLLAAAAVGAVVYTAYATDREYARLIAAGDHALADEQPFRALEAYSGAIALRPDSMIAHLKRGITYRDRGELDEAMRDLRRAEALDPTATLPHELLGDGYHEAERYDRAIEHYQAFLRLDDRAPRVWYKLGLACYRHGRLAEAIDALRRAVALDRTLPEAHLLLGLAERDQGRLREARSALETAATLAPALTAPREALAAVYAASNEPALAIDELQALAALEPARPERHVALGLALARSRRHAAAVVVLSRAIERFPANPRVYGALGRVWLDVAASADDHVALKKAVEALTTAATHSDVSSETLTDLGRAHLRSGDSAAAELAFRQAIARLPVSPDAYRAIGDLAARAGRVQQARDALVRYAVLIGDSEPLAQVSAQIADYSLRLGDASQALRWISRAEDEAGPSAALDALRRRAERLAAQ